MIQDLGQYHLTRYRYTIEKNNSPPHSGRVAVVVQQPFFTERDTIINIVALEILA